MLSSVRAKISEIAIHLPEQVLDNDELAACLNGWSAAKIVEKTGIVQRHIAGPTETASDLAYAAATSLFRDHQIDRASVDFLLFCTQAPDYILPTSACILQDRLGLPTSCGALDFNLGCSGYVYGLSLAKGLIEAGSARRVLLLTADTYSKFIHPLDKSVRTLFGDGATATVIDAVSAETEKIGPFVFGTDGSCYRDLIVETGGTRMPRTEATHAESMDASGNIRSADHLFMDGPSIMNFTLRVVPKVVAQMEKTSGLSLDDLDYVILHQANQFLLDALRKKLKVPGEKFVVNMSHVGNTVSSTIPVALKDIFYSPSTLPRRAMLVGFGVGLSWAATIITF